MLTVDFFALDAEGTQIPYATIAWSGLVTFRDGNTETTGSYYQLDPPEVRDALYRIIQTSVMDPATQTWVTADSDPVRWLACLRYQFSGTYLRAGEPHEDGREPDPEARPPAGG